MWDISQGDLGHTDLQDDDLEFHSSSEYFLAAISRELFQNPSKHERQTLTRGPRTARYRPTRHHSFPTAARTRRTSPMTPPPLHQSACSGPYHSTPSSSMWTLPPCCTDAGPRSSHSFRTRPRFSTPWMATPTCTVHSGSQQPWW